MASHDLMPDKISSTHVALISVSSTFLSLSTVAVALRFVSRRLTLRLKWDDWFILGSLVFGYANLTGTVLDSTIGHGGYNIDLYSMRTLEVFVQTNIVINCTYLMSICLSKSSVLLFYHRIFQVQKPFRIASWILGFLIVAYFFIFLFASIFSYSPTEAQWKVWMTSTHIDQMSFYIFVGTFDVLLDFFLLLLPQPLVWQLKLHSKQRGLISAIFCAGVFVCITGIARTIYLTKIDTSNPTASRADAGVWQIVELNVSIICACLPTFPSLVRHYRKGSQIQTTSYAPEYLIRKSPRGTESGAELGDLSTQTERTQNDPEHAVVKSDDMGSVRVQTDIRLKWDGESQKSSGSMI